MGVCGARIKVEHFGTEASETFKAYFHIMLRVSTKITLSRDLSIVNWPEIIAISEEPNSINLPAAEIVFMKNLEFKTITAPFFKDAVNLAANKSLVQLFQNLPGVTTLPLPSQHLAHTLRFAVFFSTFCVISTPVYLNLLTIWPLNFCCCWKNNTAPL